MLTNLGAIVKCVQVWGGKESNMIQFEVENIYTKFKKLKI